MKKILIVWAFFLFLLSGAYPIPRGSAKPDDTPIVTPGADPTAYTIGYTKYRNFTTLVSWENFLGLDSATGSINNLVWNPVNTFAFTYDRGSDKLATTITNTQGVWSFDYLNYSTQVLTLKGDLAYFYLNALNYLQIRITVENNPATVITLVDVTLDGHPLGDFEGVPGSSRDWMVTGYDLSAGFTISGTLVTSGVTSSSPEHNMVEIFMAHVDHQGPVASNLTASPDPVELNAPLSVSATIDDTATGRSGIASAEYSLDSGASWWPMQAQDSAFDSAVEDVEAAFSAPDSAGTYEVCVRGQDTSANSGVGTCTQFTVNLPSEATDYQLYFPLSSNGGS